MKYQSQSGDDRAAALDALDRLADWRRDQRDSWVKIGMALHSVDPSSEMLSVWDTWSRPSDRYEDRACADQWKTFDSNAGIGVGTLIMWAKQDSGDEEPRQSSKRKPRSTRPTRSKERGKKVHPTLEKAIQAAQFVVQNKKGGAWRLTNQYVYHDETDLEAMRVLRLESSCGDHKWFFPVSAVSGGWMLGDPDEPLLLYNLRGLGASNRVYVVEGEKCVDAAMEIGLVAVTSSHGASQAHRSDWSPLAGRELICLPDQDDGGMRYADSVKDLVAELDPPCSFRTVELPDLPDKGDLADFVEIRRRDGCTNAEIVEEIEQLADSMPARAPENAAEPQPKQILAHLERYVPFPTKLLPHPLDDFVAAGAVAIGCDGAAIALPLLSGLAAAVGNSRRLQLKRGWEVPAIIWSALVGDSGTQKSPAFRLVLKPFKDRQEAAMKRHAEAEKAYGKELARWEKQVARWKHATDGDSDPPEKPNPPQAELSVISDVTVEAMAPLLIDNERGLLLARDELVGWFGSFDRYAGGKGGGDAAHWLSMYNGDGMQVDRKSGTPRTLVVPNASVSVTGGIQPSVLHKALGTEHRDSGLAARLLLASPPRKAKQWTDDDIDPEMMAKLAEIVNRLYDLKPRINEDGESVPVVIKLSPEAKVVWVEYYNQHGKEQVNLSGELAAAWAKLEEYAARIALVHHHVRWAASDPSLKNEELIDECSMRAAVQLIGWFKNEIYRVYGLLGESDEAREQRSLIEWIDNKGGSVTIREVQQGNRQFKTSESAELALKELVDGGYGEWFQPPSQRGRPPGRRFRLSTVYENEGNAGKSGHSVDVDGVDVGLQSDEWGEV